MGKFYHSDDWTVVDDRQQLQGCLSSIELLIEIDSIEKRASMPSNNRLHGSESLLREESKVVDILGIGRATHE